MILDGQIQVSADGSTVWVHSEKDGSTVGRFSKSFGLDVHTTVSAQLEGKAQCLHCTHEQAGPEDWARFVELMEEHHGISVPMDAIAFTAESCRQRQRA